MKIPIFSPSGSRRFPRSLHIVSRNGRFREDPGAPTNPGLRDNPRNEESIPISRRVYALQHVLTSGILNVSSGF